MSAASNDIATQTGQIFLKTAGICTLCKNDDGSMKPCRLVSDGNGGVTCATCGASNAVILCKDLIYDPDMELECHYQAGGKCSEFKMTIDCGHCVCTNCFISQTINVFDRCTNRGTRRILTTCMPHEMLRDSNGFIVPCCQLCREKFTTLENRGKYSLHCYRMLPAEYYKVIKHLANDVFELIQNSSRFDRYAHLK